MSNDNSTNEPANESADQVPTTPPDDFGAALIAEFEKRGTSIPSEDDAPPGGWPGGATADASDIVFDIEAAAKQANSEAVEQAADDDAGDEGGSGEGESQPPGDATEGTPDAQQAAEGEQKPPVTDPAGTDGGDSAGGEGAATTPPPAGYTWAEGEQTHTFTDDEVRRGLMLNNWAAGLAEPIRQQFAAIEQGQAVAISRADYEKFTAFQAQQEKQTRDADLSDLSDIDPQTAQIIAGLRDEVAQLKGQAPQQQPEQYGNLRGNLDDTAQQIDAATRTYASAANIPVEQAEQLLSAATQSGVFRHFAEAQAQRHPMSNQVVAPPNWNNVVKSALDYARTQIAGQQQQPTQQQQPAPTQQNTDPNPPPDPGITAKKARAASVASAPSGAIPKTPAKNANLTTAQRIQAMADEIAAATANA